MSTVPQITSAAEWQGKRDVGGRPLALPSGNTALVRPLDPTAFLDSDIMPNPLLNIIRKAIQSQKGLPPSAMKQISEDPELLTSALILFDRVLTRVVIEPPIAMPPPCALEVDGVVCGEYANEDIHKTPMQSGHHAYREGERSKDVLYADQVDMTDKTFVFQWCLGGTSDLEKFRQEQESHVGVVSGGKNVQRTSKRTSARRKP